MAIKTFQDGSFVEFKHGEFDDWCVFYTNSSSVRKAPKDKEYFTALQKLADEFTIDKVYGDFVKVFDWTGKKVDDTVLANITKLADSYGKSALSADVIFTVLYMAMIAEENKKYSKVGKRIKRLGVHTLLVENLPVDKAADFMRGMNWREIDRLCKERGF